jgi:hypothetical protein
MITLKTNGSALTLPSVIVLSAMISLVTTSQAQAYIDPGAGSLILQALAAMGVGVLFYIRAIISFFKRQFDKLRNPQDSKD